MKWWPITSEKATVLRALAGGVSPWQRIIGQVFSLSRSAQIPGAVADRHHKGCRRAGRSKRCGRPGRSWLAGRFTRAAAIAPPAPGIGRAACRALPCLGDGPYGAQLMVQPREQGGAAEVSAVGHHGGHAASTGRPSRRHSSMPSARWRAARPLARSWRTASRASTR